MDFKISRKLGYKLEKVIHVGAHKFEETPEYVDYGSNQILWIDPFPQIDPMMLPENQEFLRIAIDDVQSKSFRDFRIYEATGFSSFYELDSPGSLLRGTPTEVQTVRVEVNSLRNIQQEFNLSEFETLVVDTQGSEFEILNSANLDSIHEIVVETSRVPLYTSETKHSKIHQLLRSQGFHHNFNASDYFYGHGDQYYSRKPKTKYLSEYTCRTRQTVRFISSFLARTQVGMNGRFSRLLKHLKGQ